jgi:abequosyltransferase
MKNNIVLSICIPTFNRASYLKKTLDSIVNQRIFKETNSVEVIISDNNSEDDTKSTCLVYTLDYPDKVKYFKNHSNIGDLNFEKSLSYGKGLYLKLNNDTLSHKANSLENMIAFIEKNKNSKNILFFLNECLNKHEDSNCSTIDSFIRATSFWSGWIGGFGIWKSDFLSIEKFRDLEETHLAQIVVNFEILKSGRFLMVNNEQLFHLNSPSRKGGYDLLDVFLGEYLSILRREVSRDNILRRTYYIEKRKVLLNLILPWLVESSKNAGNISFTANNKWRRIWKEYRNDVVTLSLFAFLYPAKSVKSFLSSSIIAK